MNIKLSNGKVFNTNLVVRMVVSVNKEDGKCCYLINDSPISVEDFNKIELAMSFDKFDTDLQKLRDSVNNLTENWKKLTRVIDNDPQVLVFES